MVGIPDGVEHFDAILRERGCEIADVMAHRTTQTNEPARCAVLLPVISAIKGPVALIEVGASAGLCLLPDRYGYRYGQHTIAPPPEFAAFAPTLSCEASSRTPIPARHPDVVWRRGLDLNPLDVDRDDDIRWLECLVWPEQTARLERLRAAIRVARADKPSVLRGDLRHDLADLLQSAPRDATCVVFHTAVLTYLASLDDRDRFALQVMDAGALWMSNESPKVFPHFAPRDAKANGRFMMMRNARPVAWTGPHGQSIDWLELDT